MRPVDFTVLALCLALLGGCGDGADAGDQCSAGFAAQGSACVPIFDDCPGPAEIPVLGGGCQQVGVTQCATGFVTDDNLLSGGVQDAPISVQLEPSSAPEPALPSD